MKGTFITFEGSEGCGKSTQSKLLKEYLEQQGHKVLFVREPGGTVISEKIRQILLDKKNDGMSATCEMLLYMAARSQIVEEVIKPALGKGMVVICDRFLDSTLAYQGYGLGMDLKVIKSVGELATGGISPDLTILLDVPLEQGLAHRKDSQDRIEKRSLEYHQNVRKGYFELARLEPKRIQVIAVENNMTDTQESVRKAVNTVIG
ncbi:MAG TPA: dTMP kinase [Candidatus Omnitrophota bacterium]|nr:dTMP kinase [Candidatus Omnitrophota bacterium]HPT07350.1 dTMP kinase [Candidatus Omnitrophota bacterium]